MDDLSTILGRHLPALTAEVAAAQAPKTVHPKVRRQASRQLFDLMRVRSYPDRPRYDSPTLWREHVLQLARCASGELDLILPDRDVVAMAERHAEWSWTALAHFALYLHDPERQAMRGVLSGASRRLRVRGRDQLILQLLDRFPGTTFEAVARAAGISATQVMRVVRREAADFWGEIRRRFTTTTARRDHAASRRTLGRYARKFRKLARAVASWTKRKREQAEAQAITEAARAREEAAQETGEAARRQAALEAEASLTPQERNRQRQLARELPAFLRVLDEARDLISPGGRGRAS